MSSTDSVIGIVKLLRFWCLWQDHFARSLWGTGFFCYFVLLSDPHPPVHFEVQKWGRGKAKQADEFAAAPLLIAFVACVIGGMSNLTGAVVGGYLYGIVYSVLSLWLPQYLLDYREAFMFLIVILILLVRPEGLIRGNTTSERIG